MFIYGDLSDSIDLFSEDGKHCLILTMTNIV